MAFNGAIATAHPATLAAVEQVLHAGGNAFDAAIAGAFAACISEPAHASIGGGGVLIAKPFAKPARSYDFYPRSPAQMKLARELKAEQVNTTAGLSSHPICIGPATVAIPGFVAGLFRLHADLGRVPIRELIEPALALCKEPPLLSAYMQGCGYPGGGTAPGSETSQRSPDSNAAAEELSAAIENTPTATQAGQPSQHDHPNLELADFLEVLTIEGESLFYRGEVARSLVESLDGGSHLDREVMAAYDVHLERCWEYAYHDLTLWLPPPPVGQGSILLCMQLDLLKKGIGKLGVDVEARRLAAFAAAGEVCVKHAVQSVAESQPGDSLYENSVLDKALRAVYARRLLRRKGCLGAGTQLCIADANGNVVSVALSNGQGSTCMIPGTGSMANNLLGQDEFERLEFDGRRVPTRLSSLMCPLVARWPDETLSALGAGGRGEALDALAQVLTDMVNGPVDLEKIVGGERVKLRDEVLTLEGPVDEDRLVSLLRRYPEHEILTDCDIGFGAVNALTWSAESRQAAGDPRWQGVALH